MKFMPLKQKLRTILSKLYERFAAWAHPRLVPISIRELKILYLINSIFFFCSNIIMIIILLFYLHPTFNPAWISMPSHVTPNPSVNYDYSKSLSKFNHFMDSLHNDSLGKEWFSRMKLQEPPLLDSIDQLR
jgi:hypothetical protein